MANEYYENILNLKRKRSAVWKAIASYLQKEIPQNAIILELGAGSCDFINNIKAKEKHALDINKDFMCYADNSVKTYVTNCTDLIFFKNNFFDVIFASNLFEHLTEEEVVKSFLEIRRCLKSDGKLIIIQPNFKYAKKDYFRDRTHKSIFTAESLCKLLEKYHFKIKKKIPKFLPLTLKSKLPKFSFLTSLYLKLPFKFLAKQMLIIAQK